MIKFNLGTLSVACGLPNVGSVVMPNWYKYNRSVLGTMQTSGRGQRYSIDWYHRETILASLSKDLPTQYDMYMDDKVPASFSCSEERKKIRLKSETGTLASYNYSPPYDANIECIWLIDVDQSYNVELSFEFFNLSSSRDCSEDYVIVRDSLYSSSDVVGEFRGSNKPQSITSDA
ncbi:tolloid-like protein 1 [Acropora millepora]|uniref:tolloid-like protein 1 n=1 Tax=Acropora millepora TaxID=45264 RepID=UPI001CF29507|nr:tolloid-like protein 1 [Acropora millepora]